MTLGTGNERSAVWLAVLLWALAPRAVAAACEDRGRPCCDYCGMIITEKVPAFGGEARMKDGSWLRFDAAECIAALWITKPRDTLRVRTLLAIDHDRPARRIDAKRAWYLRSDSLPSPMAVNLSAYETLAAARAARRRHGGSLMRWPEVVELVRVRWHFDQKTR